MIKKSTLETMILHNFSNGITFDKIQKKEGRNSLPHLLKYQENYTHRKNTPNSC